MFYVSATVNNQTMWVQISNRTAWWQNIEKREAMNSDCADYAVRRAEHMGLANVKKVAA